MVEQCCGWCGEQMGRGINHSLCIEPLQEVAVRLDERAASVDERAAEARVKARILRVVA